MPIQAHIDGAGYLGDLSFQLGAKIETLRPLWPCARVSLEPVRGLIGKTHLGNLVGEYSLSSTDGVNDGIT